MNRKQLESYQVNRRLIQRNRENIENEKCRDIPVMAGCVKGSSHDFPYTSRRFSVQMSDPVETDKSKRRIKMWKQEISQAEKEMAEVEQFISDIAETRDREILAYRYIDGMKLKEIGEKTCYTHGRVSQIISKYLKD